MKFYEANKLIVHKSNKENKHFKLKLNAFADLSPEEQQQKSGLNFGSKNTTLLEEILPAVNAS